MAAETQAFLDEAASPTIQPHAQTRSAVAAFVPEAGDTIQQFAALRKLLSAADITEEEEGIRQKFGEGRQKIGAMIREMQNAEEAARKCAAILRELAAWNADLRQTITNLGSNYTV